MERFTATTRASGDHARGINVGPGERALSTALGAALLARGLRPRSLGGLVLAALGGALVHRGVTGRCQLYQALGIDTAPRASGTFEGNLGVKVEAAVRIAAPPERLYRFWRDLGNLPRVMSHVESVQMRDDRRSRWRVRTAPGVTFEWDAEIINERTGELIAWRTVGEPAVAHAGSVRFERSADGAASVVRVSLQYDPPGGELGHTVAGLFGADAGRRIEEDLARFKQAVERGELAA